jgi:hypothetical protein
MVIITGIIIIFSIFNLSHHYQDLIAQSLEEELQDIKEQSEETQEKIEEAEKVEKQ